MQEFVEFRRRNFVYSCPVGTLNISNHQDRAMQNPAQYRKYAEECRRLAQLGSLEHKTALLDMAEAWTKCAEELEEAERANKKKTPNDVLGG